MRNRQQYNKNMCLGDIRVYRSYLKPLTWMQSITINRQKEKVSKVLVLRAPTLSGKKDEETSANETQRMDNKIGGKSRGA